MKQEIETENNSRKKEICVKKWKPNYDRVKKERIRLAGD